MPNLTETSTGLLKALRDPSDSGAQAAFEERYRPIVTRFAEAIGLGDADADEVATESLGQFVQEYRQKRDGRDPGRLSTWLIEITKSNIASLRRSRARAGHWRGDSALVDLADETYLTTLWEAKRREQLLREALGALHADSDGRDQAIRAFELVAFGEMSPEAAAAQLKISAHEVCLAKGRVAQRLRELLATLDASYDDLATAGEERTFCEGRVNE